MRIAFYQANPTVGDIHGNLRKLLDKRAALPADVELLVTPEQYLLGYPAEDLVLSPLVHGVIAQALDELCAATQTGPAVLVGTPYVEDGKVYNAAVLAADGAIQHVFKKYDLPNYGVFDEKRVFAQGPIPRPFNFRGLNLGVLICEDIWTAAPLGLLRNKLAAQEKVDLLIAPNGSPYEYGKAHIRHALARARVTEIGCPLVYINLVGGQDEIIFDGNSFVMNTTGEMVATVAAFTEDTFIYDTATSAMTAAQPQAFDEEAELYEAILLGIRDYVNKNNFNGVVLGLSGGVDSALVATLAVDALGARRVRAIMMPSPYTAPISQADADSLAQNLGIELKNIPIQNGMQATHSMLAVFGDLKSVAAENLQSRLRGLLLMAASNQTGDLLLTTGNKSEMAVGYATLYGDMNGGFNPIKDVYKTDVYRLCHWRNMHLPVGVSGPASPIPHRILTRAPSAELKDNQTDQDSLPPYDILDQILFDLIEHNHDVADLTAKGIDKNLVLRVIQMLDRAEFKRRQAAPGVKLHSRAFGRDRRYPITNGFSTELLTDKK